MSSTRLLILCAAISLSACGGEQEAVVTDNAAPTVPVQTGQVLPIEDNAAKAAAEPGTTARTMPETLHGRWGLKAADCTAPGANGLVTITANEVRFYESVAKPDAVRSRSETAIHGDFAFTGEGMSWTGPMSWSVAGDKLTRIDSEEDSRLVYIRC